MRSISWVALAPFLFGCRGPTPASDVSTVARLSGAAQSMFEQPLEVEPGELVRASLSQPLSEEDAVRIALSQNREVQAALLEVGIARGNLIQAGLLPNPTIEAEIPAEREALVGLGVEFDLTEALLAPSRARAVLPTVDAARFAAAREVVRIAAQTRIAFVRLQSAGRRLAIASLILETYAAENDALSAAHEAGNVPDLSLAVRSLNYEIQKREVQGLQIEVATRRGALASIMGFGASDAGFEIENREVAVPELGDIPSDLEGQALTASLDLNLSRARLDALGAQTGYVRARGNTPDVSIGAQAVLSREEEATNQDIWTFGAGLSTTLPLFDRQTGSLRATEAEFEAGLRRHLALAAAIRTEAQVLAERLKRTHETTALFLNSVVPAAERRSAELLLQYNAMQVDVLALLEGRRAELISEREAVRSEEEFLVTRALYVALQEGCLVQEGARISPSSPEIATSEGH